MRTSLALILILSLISVCVAFAEEQEFSEIPLPKRVNTAPLPRFELRQFRYCGSDSDCIKANNGCCDCANGGQDVAINKQRLSEFRGKFDCMDVTCTEVKTTPPCASGVVSCVNHLCEYVPRPDAK